jgi:uracil-DNA glycosylase
VVLNNAFRIPSGVIVDTHVARVSGRLGLTDQTKPERIEAELMQLLPRDEWIAFGAEVVLHGRYVCTARGPRCAQCILEDLCPKIGVTAGEDGSDPAGFAGGPRDDPFEGAAVGRAASSRRGGRVSSSIDLPLFPDEDEVSTMSSKGTFAGIGHLPEDWHAILADELDKPYFHKLQEFVAAERRAHKVFPPEEDVFNALRLTPYARTNVLLLGQDPYHDDGQAHGLCFSVRPGVKPPPSLVNMFKELRDDLGCTIPKHGYLVHWAEQGVLLLNAVLTVRAHEANSHKDKGWEIFTDAIIRAVNDKPDPVVFVLWGAYAQKKAKLIDGSRHAILTAAHPSPLSAKKFFGSRPFSAINNALRSFGKPPIDWQLPDRV